MIDIRKKQLIGELSLDIHRTKVNPITVISFGWV